MIFRKIPAILHTTRRGDLWTDDAAGKRHSGQISGSGQREPRGAGKCGDKKGKIRDREAEGTDRSDIESSGGQPDACRD